MCIYIFLSIYKLCQFTHLSMRVNVYINTRIFVHICAHKHADFFMNSVHFDTKILVISACIFFLIAHKL